MLFVHSLLSVDEQALSFFKTTELPGLSQSSVFHRNMSESERDQSTTDNDRHVKDTQTRLRKSKMRESMATYRYIETGSEKLLVFSGYQRYVQLSRAVEEGRLMEGTGPTCLNYRNRIPVPQTCEGV